MNEIFKQYDITHTFDLISDLNLFLEQTKPSGIFVLTDTNCKKHCFPLIQKAFKDEIRIFEIVANEQNKTTETLATIWDFLLENKADRNAVLINLGGGIVTDLGGFAASTYKRGINFINIPTSLLAQIDASAGGKNGVNYKGVKNQIGTITLPKKVFIYHEFLKTLSEEEFLSGFGEMLKHALIFDKNHYEELIHFINTYFSTKKIQNFNSLIEKSVNIKIHFVKNDLKEKNIRKTLNFGHTFGHALESYFNHKEQTIKHGKAVAYGIICDLYLSVLKHEFKEALFFKISKDILKIYSGIHIPEKDFNTIYNYMLHDKKNIKETVRTVLLKDIGIVDFNAIIMKNDVIKALSYLNILSKDF